MPDKTFTWGPANVTTLLATTMEKRRGQIADAVFNDMVLLAWLHDKNRTTVDGGAQIVVPIMSEGSSAAAFYHGYGVLDITPQEGHTSAAYNWKQASVPVSVSGREERIQNAGSSIVHRIVTAKQRQAELSIRDKINKAFFSSSVGADDIGSLVSTIDATSTIGDINSTNNSWWQAAVTTGGSFATQGLSDMRTLWNTLAQRNPVGGTGLIITTSTVYEFYEGTLQPQQRFTGSVSANGSFENLLFKTAPVTFDAAANSGVMYFLNADALEFISHSGTNFIMSEFVKPANQDARIAQMLFAGELVAINRRKLGKIDSIVA